MSDVARLKQRIEEEISSMYLLMHAPAVVSRHDLINHKYRRLGCYQEQLAQVIGPDAAALVVDQASSLAQQAQEAQEDQEDHHD